MGLELYSIDVFSVRGLGIASPPLMHPVPPPQGFPRVTLSVIPIGHVMGWRFAIHKLRNEINELPMVYGGVIRIRISFCRAYFNGTQETSLRQFANRFCKSHVILCII